MERYQELPRELRELIAKVEGLEIETKETASEEVLNQFSKSCAAFANTQGGSIVIGVNRNGRIVGANIDQQVMDRISSEAANCRPPVKVQLNLYQEEGKTVLQVFVPKSEYLHTDKSFRFPLRTGSVTSYMELGTILAYAKERNLVGGESKYAPETRERRKLKTNELELFVDGLSNEEPRVRAYALANLFSLVFSTKIETEEKLPSRLKRVIQDPDANVRKSAFRLYALLNSYAALSERKKYNKIIPLAIEVANHDNDMEVRREAISALVATGDKRVIETIIEAIHSLLADEYKIVVTDNLWYSLVAGGLGPEFRRELFKEFTRSTDENIRKRIEEITQRTNLG